MPRELCAEELAHDAELDRLMLRVPTTDGCRMWVGRDPARSTQYVEVAEAPAEPGRDGHGR